jgi:hypothetical protein
MRINNYHEDDFCQIELIPFDNLDFIKTEISNLHDFSNKHKVVNGIGWTDIYNRKENPIKTIDKNIHINEIETVLDKCSIKFDKVQTGCGQYIQNCDNTISYGINNNSSIFFDFNSDKIVENIWMNIYITTLSEKDDLHNIVNNLSLKFDFLLVGWGWEFYETINNIETIDEYLLKRIEIFSKNK